MRYVLLGLGLLAAGCAGAAPSSDEATAGSDLVAPPSRPSLCDDAARAAVLELAHVNEETVAVTRTEATTSATADRSLVRVHVTTSWLGGVESFLVATEPAGDACSVTSLQRSSASIDLSGGGPAWSASPTAVCREVAFAAVTALSAKNGHPATPSGAELISAMWDHELLRVSATEADGSTSRWIVNTESMGGSPCYVYGLQRDHEPGTLTLDR